MDVPKSQEPDVVSVVVHGARGLQSRKKKNDKGRCKFSVIFGVGQSKFRTDVVEDLFGSPVWNTEGEIPVDDVSKPLLLVVTEKDEVLGQVSVPIHELPSAKPYQNKKVALQPHKKISDPSGDLMLSAWISAVRSPRPPKASSSKISLKKVKEKLSHSPMLGRKFGSKKGSPGPLRGSMSVQDLASRRKSAGGNLMSVPSDSLSSLSSNGSDLPTGGSKFYSSCADLTEDAGGAGALRPEVSGISPREGPLEGGTRLTLRGHNLGRNMDDVIGLYVCGMNCLATVEYESPSKLFCTTKPVSQAATGEIIVETRGGGKGSSMVTFSFIDTHAPPPPSPGSHFGAGAAAAGDSPMLRRTLSGSSAHGKPPLPSPRLRRHSKKNSDTSLISTGSGVGLSAHSEQAADERRPEVTGISPREGPSEGGTRLTIRGQNLGRDASDVIGLFVCGRDVLSTLEWSSSRKVFCTTRAWRPGAGDITVETASGGRGTSSVQFTYAIPVEPEPVPVTPEPVPVTPEVTTPAPISPRRSYSSPRGGGSRPNSASFAFGTDDDDDDTKPEVTGMSPREGSSSGGTRLTIRGLNLGQNSDDVIGLKICGCDCLATLEYVSPIKLLCTTLPWSAGSGDVIVETQSSGKGSSLVQFKFTDTPPAAMPAALPTHRHHHHKHHHQQQEPQHEPLATRMSSPTSSVDQGEEAPVKPPRRAVKSEMYPSSFESDGVEEARASPAPTIAVTPPQPQPQPQPSPTPQVKTPSATSTPEPASTPETQRASAPASAPSPSPSSGAVAYGGGGEDYSAVPYDPPRGSPPEGRHPQEGHRPQPVGQERQASPGKERKRHAPPPPSSATTPTSQYEQRPIPQQSNSPSARGQGSVPSRTLPATPNGALPAHSTPEGNKRHPGLSKTASGEKVGPAQTSPIIDVAQRGKKFHNEDPKVLMLLEDVDKLKKENRELKEQNVVMKQYLERLLSDVMSKCPDVLCVDHSVV